MKERRAMLQNLHIMPRGNSVRRACGATTGAFAREREEGWLRKFLRNGGGLCPECAKLYPNLPNVQGGGHETARR